MRHHRLQATQCTGAHSTFDLLFKQSGRSFLLSVLQSVPRLENKPLFVLRPPPSLLSYTPPQLQQGRAGGVEGGGLCNSLVQPCTAVAKNSDIPLSHPKMNLNQQSPNLTQIWKPWRHIWTQTHLDKALVPNLQGTPSQSCSSV